MRRKDSNGFRRLVSRWFVVGSSWLLGAVLASAVDLRPTPVFEGPTIPRPPHQNDPWDANLPGFPTNFLSAIKTLFDQGLADPRGCEYREVEIVSGSVWGGKGIIKVHGWVFPEESGKTNRFAVCWNGLVYPLASVGAVQSLFADVTNLVATGQAGYNSAAMSDGRSASETSLLPLKAALLIRLGETNLGHQLLYKLRDTGPLLLRSVIRVGANSDRNPTEPNPDRLWGDDEPYLPLASHWAWALFDRTIWAHMHGDDGLALFGARELSRMEKDIESAAETRGIERPPSGFFSSSRTNPEPYVSFLQPVPAMLVDQERRAREPKRRQALDIGLSHFTNQLERVAALIKDLEFVAARQDGQPGWVSFGHDPIASALRNEGDAAVDGLIECLRSDRRLTRSVGFGRDFHQGRTPIGVDSAAQSLLSDIVQKPISGADAWRRYWDENKRYSLHQRWYHQLADDAAGVDAWLEAGSRIVGPANVSRVSGWTVTSPLKAGENPKCTAESLRTNTTPSVSELLARRARSAFPTNIAAPESAAALDKACSLARALAIWDGPASLPVTKEQMQRSIAISKADQVSIPSITLNIARFARRRAEAGDTKALDEYAKWLEKIPASQVQPAWKEAAETLWRFPNHPGLKQAGQRLFGEIVPIMTVLTNGETFARPHFIATPALGIDGLQKAIIHSLSNTTLTIDQYGRTNGRVCDRIAAMLSDMGGFPQFDSGWPEARRNAAMPGIAQFLERYGARFKYAPEIYAFEDWGDPKAGMVFPQLSHPATRDDVKSGKAIFSLKGEGRARTFKLPQHPIGARWATLKEFPYVTQTFNPRTGVSAHPTNYYQDGLIWQAEEVQIRGSWQRFYGFVGKYKLAKVAAEDIEFPADWRTWCGLSCGLDCRVKVSAADGSSQISLNAPIAVEVFFRNRRGVDQDVPTEFVQNHPQPMLRSGVKMTLSRATDDEVVAEITKRSGRPVEYWNRKWAALECKVTEVLQPGTSTSKLGPTEESAPFVVKLNDWFNISEPGTYLLQFTFSEKDGGFAKGTSNEVLLNVLPRPEENR